MTTQETRTFLTEVFTAWSQANDPAPFVAALADDLVWTVTGTSPIAGTYHGRHQYLAGVLQPLSERLSAIPTLRVVRMLIDGDWACLHLEGRARRQAGRELRHGLLLVGAGCGSADPARDWVLRHRQSRSALPALSPPRDSGTTSYERDEC